MRLFGSKIDQEDVKVYTQAFLTGFLYAPFSEHGHELGHYGAMYLLGARDMKVSYLGVYSEEIDSFPDHKLLIIYLAGPIVSSLLNVGGFLLLRPQPGRFSRLLGLAMVMPAWKIVVWLIQYYLSYISGKVSKYDNNDEMRAAKKLRVSPALILTLEALLAATLIGKSYLMHLEKRWGINFCVSLGTALGIIFWQLKLGAIIVCDKNIPEGF